MFIKRDDSDRIIEAFANPQEGLELEEIEDDAQELQDFLKNLLKPSGNWRSLLTTFLAPGNQLYEAVLGLVAQADFISQKRLQNLEQLIINPNLQGGGAIDRLGAAVHQLASSLEGAGHPLTQKLKDDWNKLMDDCGFPDECKF